MEADPAALLDDITALKAALIAERARADAAQAEAAIARAQQSDAEALVARQKLEIEKLKREIYGPRSERARRLIDQLELELEELEATATEDELRAEQDVAKATTVAAFSRKRPARKPFPEHLPRERVIVPGRGHHRDARGHPPALEGDPARPREVQLPRL
jgi:transposase